MQEIVSGHGEERPLPGQPHMKRVKWSGMHTRSDGSDDDSFLEKSRRDPSEVIAYLNRLGSATTPYFQVPSHVTKIFTYREFESEFIRVKNKSFREMFLK